jgi:glyoxylase-like metal-dependent hydrolase (beta-lactamase superfamily II)
MRFLFSIFLFSVYLSADCLQMHGHNVGQGNAVFFKNGQRALIVDCGYFQTGKYCFSSKAAEKRNFESGGIFRPIVNFLNGATEITVVITHRHFDHHSLLQYLPNDLYGKISTIYERIYGKSDGYALYLPEDAEEVLPYIKIRSGKLIPWVHVEKESDIPHQRCSWY